MAKRKAVAWEYSFEWKRERNDLWVRRGPFVCRKQAKAEEEINFYKGTTEVRNVHLRPLIYGDDD